MNRVHTVVTLQKSLANHMQTAFNGPSPGRNNRRRIDAPGIRDDDILLEGNLMAVEQARARGT